LGELSKLSQFERNERAQELAVESIKKDLSKLPRTESISDRLLRLPFYNELTLDDQAQVIESIQELT